MYRAALAVVLLCFGCLDTSSDGFPTTNGERPPSPPPPVDGGPDSNSPDPRFGKCAMPPKPCPNGWCWEYSLPPRMDYKAISGTACNNLWIVGGPQYKVILQWNGTAWAVHKHNAPGTLYGVWGTEVDNAWAVGEQGAIVQWDGYAWFQRSSGTGLDLLAVWGTDANNVWTVGKGGTILKWDGTRWSPQTSGTSVALYAVWGSDARNVWAAGEGGTILKWNGTSWSPQMSGTATLLNGIWGSDARNVWAVGEEGIRKWDGASWSKQACRGCNNRISTVWGVAANSAWAYSSGVLIRWNGTEWFAESSLPDRATDVRVVWGIDADHMWGIGQGGTLYKKETAGWVSTRTAWHEWGGNLKYIHGVDENNVFAGGWDLNGVRSTANILKWNGTSWTDLTPQTGLLSGLWVGSAKNVWIGGVTAGPSYTQYVTMWDGTEWTNRKGFIPPAAPRSIGGSGPSDVLIPSGTEFWRWDGTMFTNLGVGGAEAIWTYDANNIWMAGGGTVAAYRGKGPMAVWPPKPLHALWGTSPDNVWAVGEDGTIMQCASGKICNPQPSGTTKNLRGVWAKSTSAAWAVGDAGTLVEWDGMSWILRINGLSIDLLGIWGSGNEVWIVGEHGAILHKKR